MRKTKKYLYCKKDYIREGNNKIIFHKGEKYYYYDSYSEDDIFVYYDEKSIDEYKRGRRFYFKQDDHIITVGLIYDYFCTPTEERKLKLEKINEI